MSPDLDMRSGTHAADAAWQHLQARLCTPAASVSPSQIEAIWDFETIEIMCEAPPALEEDFGLPARVRGGWGECIYELFNSPVASVSGSSLPGAKEVFFGQMPTFLGKQQIAKPYVIATRRREQLLHIAVRLFGFARFWADEAEDALIAALHKGIALRNGGKVRASLRVVDVRREYGILPRRPEDNGIRNAKLIFETPFSVRSSGIPVLDPSAVLLGLGARISGLARWMDMSVDTEWKALKKLADEELQFDISGLQQVRWSRHSRNHPTRPIPMSGFIGTLSIAGRLSPFLPFLTIGETCHAGGQATLGLGRYRLVTFT